MSQKTVKSLLKNFTDGSLKLVKYRDFLAIDRGGIVCLCPDNQIPCNSSCLFFDLRKERNTLTKETTIRVVISCRSIRLFLVLDS